MQPWFKDGVKSLYQVAPLFSSTDRHEAKQGTAGALKEHDLVWRDGPVDSQLRQLDIGDLSLFLLRYGAAVHIAPGALQDFLLFQVPIHGEARIRVGRHNVVANPQTGVVISPTLELDLDWARGCEQLLLKIPRARLEAVCANLLGSSLGHPLEFSPLMQLDSVHGKAWQHQLLALLHFSRALPINSAPGVFSAHENALIQHLLLCQDNNYSHRLQRQTRAPERRLRVAQEYIQQHLQEGLCLADIARASGSSARSISLAFQEHYQLSPMAYVREQRLAAAHADLLQATPGTRVTDIALKWGFNHLGRFCGYYHQRYGRSPLQMLKS